jgi:hypothetical protein
MVFWAASQQEADQANATVLIYLNNVSYRLFNRRANHLGSPCGLTE